MSPGNKRITFEKVCTPCGDLFSSSRLDTFDNVNLCFRSLLLSLRLLSSDEVREEEEEEDKEEFLSFFQNFFSLEDEEFDEDDAGVTEGFSRNCMDIDMVATYSTTRICVCFIVMCTFAYCVAYLQYLVVHVMFLFGDLTPLHMFFCVPIRMKIRLN